MGFALPIRHLAHGHGAGLVEFIVLVGLEELVGGCLAALAATIRRELAPILFSEGFVQDLGHALRTGGGQLVDIQSLVLRFPVIKTVLGGHDFLLRRQHVPQPFLGQPAHEFDVMGVFL